MAHKSDSEIIEALGGTSRVAALCQVKPPSVSIWKRDGIPAARRMYLQLLRPDVFGLPAEAGQSANQAESVASHG